MIEIKQLRKRSTNHEIVISEYIITIVHSKIVWKSSYSSEWNWNFWVKL